MTAGVGELGTRHAIIMSAGCEETGEEGLILGRQLPAISAAADALSVV